MSFLKTLLIILIPLVIGGGLVFGIANSKPELLGLPSEKLTGQSEVDRLVLAVGKLMTLPTDEKPTVATVTDLEKIKEQQFFKNANAMVGDKVLIYTTAKKVILYRPSENKIIDVGVVSINEPVKPVISPISTIEATPSGTPKSTLKPSPTATGSGTPKSTPVFSY